MLDGAYLKADYGPIEAVLQALQAAPLRTVAQVTVLRPELRRRFAAGGRGGVRYEPIARSATRERIV